MLWADLAACRDTPMEVMFPPLPAGPGVYAEAKALCARCPVAAECLAYALANRQNVGCWGGMSPRERKAYRQASA